jgi:polyferredoxin
MSLLGLGFSVLVILGAFIKQRFWCRFCPLGLILSWYRKISFFKLKKDDVKCTRCEICYNVCPMDIEEVFKSRGRTDVTFPECHLCLKCVENCPEPDALKAVYLGIPIYCSASNRFFKKRGIRTNIGFKENAGGT